MYMPKSQLENHINADDRVLDIGSWNDVFPRADVVIDINPYDTRNNKYVGEREFFSRDSWLQADCNKPETWSRFNDKEFDFVICSHLLEDVRDPLFVCEQLIRVARRGYIEVPTRYRECSRAKASDTVSGYDHHRWLVDVIDGSLVFTAKLHWAHTVDYLTDKRRDLLNFHNFHYFGCFFDDSFHYYERCPKGELKEGANLLYQFDRLDLGGMEEVMHLSPDAAKFQRGNMLWVDQFSLPIEMQGESCLQKYIEKYQQMNNANLICSLGEDLRSREHSIRHLEESIDAIRNSSSWKITAPLRSLKRRWF